MAVPQANSKRGKPGKDSVLSPVVAKLSAKYGVTPQCLFYRWVMSEGIVPLNGSCSDEHIAQDLRVRRIPLTEEDARAIAAVVYAGL